MNYFLNSRPKIPDNFISKKIIDKYIITDLSNPNYLVLSKNAYILLRLCNGKRTIKDIINIINKKTGMDKEKEIIDFFKLLYKKSFFPNFSENYINASNKKRKLMQVQLNMTNRCNLNCKYCFKEAGNGRLENYLDLDDYKKVIDSIKNLNKKALIEFSGGEPLLSKNTIKTAEYAKRNKLTTRLLTNGTLINEKNIDDLSKNFDTIYISLDGCSKEVHEKTRGKDSYKPVINAINLMIKKGIGKRLTILITITQDNKDYVKDIYDRFHNRCNLKYSPVFKIGRAKDKKNLLITGQEYFDVMKCIYNKKAFSSALKLDKKERIIKCGMGDAILSISEKGDVFPCHLLQEECFKMGNVKDTDLKKIYDSYPKTHTIISMENIKECKSCVFKHFCWGGCRARAFIYKNNILELDPLCEYLKKFHIDFFTNHYK